MAKGTNTHGGKRLNSGRKSKSVLEKTESGNPGHRPLKVIDVPDAIEGVEMEGVDMAEPAEFLSATQRDGSTLQAGDIYKNTWMWLKQLGVEKLVPVQIIQQFAMNSARWIQCEDAVTKYGHLGKHPTSGNPMRSPYVGMAIDYQRSALQIWLQIYQIVKENCSVDYRNGLNPADDVMERLLRSRGN